MRFQSAFVIALGLGIFAGCSTNSAPGMDAKPVLVDLANNVILPTYRSLDLEAETLRTSAAELKSAPAEASLAKTQAAWRAARKVWRSADAFRFGPTESKRITAAIDFWPAGTDPIEKYLQGTDPITAESFEALGANAKGFMALEYVLFDSTGGNAAVLSRLTAGDAGARRLQFVVVATEHLKKKTAELLASWEPSGENFAKELTDGGGIFPSSKAAIDQMVNSATFAAETLVNTKIGKPFGKKNDGQPQPDQEETPRSDNSLADMEATLDGVRSVYTGARGSVDGMGIGDLVKAKNAGLDQRVIAGFDDSAAKLVAIPPPFRVAIVSQRDPVEQAYATTKALKTTMSTEVASVLGTTLKFNDNDGD